MPRKDFLRDLGRASANPPGFFSGVHDIRLGDDDESICFSFAAPSRSDLVLEFQAVVSDLSEYPKTHEYLIFSLSSTVPSAVVDALDTVRPAVAGAPIHDLFTTVSDALGSAVSASHDLLRGEEDQPSGYESLMEEGSDNEAAWEDDAFDEDQQFFGAAHQEMTQTKQSACLRFDLRAAKVAGFKVGYLGSLTGLIALSISCRIAKLGLSDEVMQAWGVDPSQYLVLLMRFPHGYVSMAHVLEIEASKRATLVQMHVGLCASYKPTMAEVVHAFSHPADDDLLQKPPGSESDNPHRKLMPLFIETPLNTLLNERFLKIVEIRDRLALSWSGAELYFNNVQGMIQSSITMDSDEYMVQDGWDASVPDIVQADQFHAASSHDQMSLPLITMQFLLRHFVKCPEFCLVCHCKIDMNFEALKPYVCSKPLCLYQYMALGIGHSVEWEILQQPFVIDLLISFTYASAAANALEDFPEGLGVMVPRIGQGTYKGNLHPSNLQLTISTDDKDEQFLRPGHWVLIMGPENDCSSDWHCRVQNTSNWPVVDLGTPIVAKMSQPAPPTKNKAQGRVVHFLAYDNNFDHLAVQQDKCQAIKSILDTLPDVMAMKSFLESIPSSSRRLLASWDRISPSAFDILRWIVASNRSCIMQDSEISGKQGARPNANLISGMKGYLQFRFAQGSPDKENKFFRAITTNVPKSPYPTLYAWHGSPLCNWHGIIREGLMYKKVTHGRAFGDGVYMAQHFSTSLGYTARSYAGGWPNSLLHINTALSLNEVINKPKKFQNHANGIYVVQNIEWIQTRYLFVNCQLENQTAKSTSSGEEESKTHKAPSKKLEYYPQEEGYMACGPTGLPIYIPMTALNQRRREALGITEQEPQTPPKASVETKKRGRKRKSSSKSAPKSTDSRVYDVSESRPVEDDCDNTSVATMDEDLAVLFSETEDEAIDSGKKKKRAQMTPVTNFEPGKLDESSLKLLDPPSYATTTATKSLQQHLIQTLKVQERNASDELGWYIDPQLINNPYQWIVELHSFELTLPLGQDLHKAGIQSIVLEMRFPKDFPMSPPFVRVVRPRLLEFNQGGGGHVTQGGALCMELLTNSGWLPSCSIEAVLVSIRIALCSMEPKPARLLNGQTAKNVMEYSVHDAVSAYVRACNAHGWEVPKEFHSMAW
ncbi:ubiquitin-conjugating enzyme E2 Q [Talaromyces islandicus]|uniref:Ubiquitin-conjugating enzyme E2 Q n=1 Tax=Talaromyces islandicus TaxID=28573 RepID=A0A0U1MAF1_TALIS|nr:ubiquitin-conjugating enzyme E2 Q [Talaromyces islandicus]